MGTSRKYRTEDYKCPKCGTNIESMDRLEQDAHEIECRKQTKLM